MFDEENSKSQQKLTTRYKKRGKLFEYSEKSPINGIISNLRNKTNGQIEKEINITGSSLYNNSENRSPRTVCFDNSDFFFSKSEQGSWICFDFKEHRVVPSSYTLRSISCRPGDRHPRSWVLEGSNDNKEWTTLDEEPDNSYLNGSKKIRSFNINKPNSKELQFIRMRITGPNWYGDNCLVIELIELFELFGQYI